MTTRSAKRTIPRPKIDIQAAERNPQFGVLVNLVRVYRRNAEAYYRSHDEHCLCSPCREHKRLESLGQKGMA